MAAASSLLTHPTTSSFNLPFPSRRAAASFPSPSPSPSPTPPQLFSFPRTPSDNGAFSASPTLCRCRGGKDGDGAVPGDGPLARWGVGVMELVKSAGRVLGFGDGIGGQEEEEVAGEKKTKEFVEEGEWDWERWKKHFVEIDEQELLISLLKVEEGSLFD